MDIDSWYKHWQSSSVFSAGWSGTGTLVLWGEAEGPGLVQPREELVSGESNSSLPVPTGIEEVEPNSSQQCTAGRQEMTGVSWTREVQTTYKEKLFRGKDIRQWSSLPRKIMEIFKTCLDKAQSNLIWPHDWPWFEQEVELEIFTDPFQPELSYHHMNSQLRHLILKETLALTYWETSHLLH